MKNKYKILATVISSIIVTSTVQANDLSFLNDGKEKKASVNIDTSIKDKSEKNALSNIEKQKLELSKFEAYIDPDIAAQRSKEVSEKKHVLQVKKLEMEQAQVSEEILELESKKNKRSIEEAIAEKQAEWDIEKEQIRKKYKQEKNDLTFEVQMLNKKLREQEENNSILKEKIFVTKVYGVGNNLKAEFYFDNNVKLLSVGEEIVDGAVAKRIEPNGVLVSFKGKEHFVSLTTPKHAHLRTFMVKEEQLMPSNPQNNPMLGLIPPTPEQSFY